MATFYAQYPAIGSSSTSAQIVQGEGTPGSPVGGLLTVQGDPAGTPIPVSGTVTATNPSVGVTGAAVPADATYAGMNVAGNLTGLTGTASGLNTVINAAIPAGANVIGAVTQSGSPWGIIGAGTPGSAAAGVVTIQGVASMTPVSVTVGTIAPVTTTTVTWQAEGSIAFGSITNAYQTIFTPSASTKLLFMRNNTDVSISVSMDGGTTLNFVLDSGDQIAVDFLSNALISTTTAIQIKYTVGAPASGSFRVNGGH